MKRCVRYILTGFLGLLAVLTLAFGAMAEQAKVITPGGAANVRKAANKKSTLVEKVPNGATVEVDEVGEEWSHIEYKNKRGYIMTSYLRLPSSAVGKTLYSNGNALCVRESADEDSTLLQLLSPADAVTVTEIRGEWAKVDYFGGSGYVPLNDIADQNESPVAQAGYIPMEGIVISAHEMYTRPDLSAPITTTLNKGDSVIVTVFDVSWALVEKDEALGYLPTAMVQLIGPEDRTGADGEIGEGKTLSFEKVREKAEKALKKQFKTFKAKDFTCIYDLSGEGVEGFSVPLYRITYINDQGKYCYIAFADAATGEVLFCDDYTPFGYQILGKTRFISSARNGVKITLSEDMIFPGDELKITVDSRDAEEYSYCLYENGKLSSEENRVPYSEVYFRPRKSGVYRLEVMAYGAKGSSSASDVYIWVADSKGAEDFLVEDKMAEDDFILYSQQDGWWKDKKYSKKSNLQVSGCAIFTLAHALEELGYEGDNALPQNLAVTYVACLVDGGTLNASLIGRAAKEFNYSTQTELIKNKSAISSRFDQGAVFSFSVVKGHIAMAAGLSDDGSMVRIIDSAPSATFERIEDAQMYYQNEGGNFLPVRDLADIPGAKYYFETNGFGGLEYYLDLDYVAKRGVRLIQPK